MVHVSISHAYARQRREDDCTDCNRQWNDADQLYLRLRDRLECVGKNMMMCKTCSVSQLTGGSLSRGERPYYTWCFDAAEFTNLVNFQLNKCSYLSLGGKLTYLNDVENSLLGYKCASLKLIHGK